MLVLSTLFSLLSAFSPPSDPRWSIVGDVGVQALGFKPLPANPSFSVGADVRLIRRRFYSLHAGGALGGFWQIRFTRGAHFDLSLSQRFTAAVGLYASLDVVLGGQLAVVPGPRYRPGPDGGLQASRATPHAAARLGLGLEAGLDLSRRHSIPLRIFMRYRQLAITPFMLGNDLPVMGLATWTGGVALGLGRWTRS